MSASRHSGKQSRSSASQDLPIENQRGSILVIEDDQQVRDFIRVALEGAGFQVAEADNGTQGIGMYRHAPKDLVITDMLLPVTSGLRVIQELTSDFPDVKLIAITGQNLGPDYLGLANQYGALQTLKKPFGPDELIQAVKSALAGTK